MSGISMSLPDLDGQSRCGPGGRVCVVCGGSLKHRRRDARHCGGPCRAEASRIRAILSGNDSVPYDSLAARISARQRRTKRPERTLTAG